MPCRSRSAFCSDTGTAEPPQSTSRRWADEVDVLVLVEVGEHVVPDRRHRPGHGGPGLAHEPAQRLGLQPAVRHHQRGAGHHRGVGQPPRVRVEHRHDRQHPVGPGQPADDAEPDRHRVQVRRPVAVDHALRVARGAGGVAHRRGVALVEIGPVEGVVRGGQQLVVQVHLLAGDPQRVEVGRRGLGARHQHVLDGLEGGQLLGEEADQGVVDDDDLVLGVVGDVGQLLGEQPDVQRVQHRAHRGDGEVGLEVLGVVPLEGADPLVAGDAQRRAARWRAGRPAGRRRRRTPSAASPRSR